MLEGRVKTLHPRVHGGLLYKRGNPLHEKQAKEQGFQPIDLVVVNLYPFEETVAKPGVTLAEAIEQIDIGGPSMIRSAAKNYESVTVVVDPADYDEVLENMRDHEGGTSLRLRERLAIKAFVKTSRYDRAIGTFLNQEQSTDASFSLSLPLVTRLRYGENPHQKAALYGDFDECFEKLHGKELSFNNILDISAATNLIGEFDRADRRDPEAHQSRAASAPTRICEAPGRKLSPPISRRRLAASSSAIGRSMSRWPRQSARFSAK